jgi:hypothetical protein
LSAKQVHNEAKPIFLWLKEKDVKMYSAQEQGEKQTRVGQSKSCDDGAIF